MFIVYGCVMSSILFSVHCHCLSTDIKAIDSVGDPPLPIPNREVKPDSADGTANICGRVGHRHFYRREFQEIGTLFFLLLIRFSSKKVWFDKIFAVVMKKRSIDNAVLP